MAEPNSPIGLNYHSSSSGEHMRQLLNRGDKTLTRKLALKKVIAPLNEGDGNNM